MHACKLKLNIYYILIVNQRDAWLMQAEGHMIIRIITIRIITIYSHINSNSINCNCQGLLGSIYTHPIATPPSFTMEKLSNKAHGVAGGEVTLS